MAVESLSRRAVLAGLGAAAVAAALPAAQVVEAAVPPSMPLPQVLAGEIGRYEGVRFIEPARGIAWEAGPDATWWLCSGTDPLTGAERWEWVVTPGADALADPEDDAFDP